ncbi:MAG TPA: hypothetical protein VLV48_00065 [Thermoanaerobaculia bacterium]|nr:hypothetical protein [Thermoanaerobaculia bacterium]
MAAASRGVTVFTLGALAPPATEPLNAHFSAVEVLPLELPPGASLAASQPALRAAVNRAANDWILILREGERVTPAAAAAMGAAVPDPPTAWGFRLKIQPSCGGRPLRLESALSGEIRFFHRRHARFDLRGRGAEMNVEGTVLRLREPIEREMFASDDAHRAWLARTGVPQSTLRRALLFARRAVAARALGSAPTLRYLWDEAGWDLGRSPIADR